MSRPRFEYRILDAPFAITPELSENDGIFTPERWEQKLNEVGEDGWEFFRYEYGKWFFKRIKE